MLQLDSSVRASSVCYASLSIAVRQSVRYNLEIENLKCSKKTNRNHIYDQVKCVKVMRLALTSPRVQ